MACDGFWANPLIGQDPGCRHRGLGANGLPVKQIDLDALTGPETNCPLGLWDGVTHPDPASVAAELAERLEESARKYIRLTSTLVKRLPDPEKDFQAALDEMETAGILPAERIAEVKRVIDAEGLSANH